MNRSDKFPEVREIADAVCMNQATKEQLQQLEQLLSGNFEAQHFYYDYISMHMHLNSDVERNMEFVYRRMTEITAVTEEFVVRPKDTNEQAQEPINSVGANNTIYDVPPEQAYGGAIPPTGNDTNKHQKSSSGSHTSLIKKYKQGLLITVLVMLLALLTWLLFNRSTEPFIAEVVQGHATILEHGKVDGNYLFPGQYQVSQDSILKLQSGHNIYLSNQSTFKLFNNQEIKLKSGTLQIKPGSENNIVVHGPNFSLLTNGGALSLDLTQSKPIIKSGENTLLLPERWRPTHYWNFDGKSDVAIDSSGDLHGRQYSGAKRIAGLIGNGAFLFDNSEKALIRVESGGGTVLGTGSFSVIDGVTIEALIRPNYSGEPGEIDQIFRKGWHDNVEIDSKELRMLLNFQNEKSDIIIKPEGDFKESLSFGLYIVGQGYHELKLPLDGQAGRPTLAELKTGKTHHIVASYNVATGLKAIYIDGKKHAFYQYPPGSKVLSGGVGRAAIGNTPASARRSQEAFSGVIDEVAFYNFSLPEVILEEHYKQVTQGHNYFGLQSVTSKLPQQLKQPLPKHTSITLDPLTGLPLQYNNQSAE